MSSVFDSPSQAVGFEPLRCGQLVGCQVGDEAYGFIFASDMLPGQKRHLGRKGEPNVLRRYGAAFQRAAFGNAFIFFGGARPGGR